MPRSVRSGRVVTPPAANDVAKTVRLGWTGDSNAYNRPFTSLDPIRVLAPDAWLYIGDTIYGDDPLADGIVAQTLSEYQGKYEENRTDQSLRGIMAATGTYVMWDDHEVRNDFCGCGSSVRDPHGHRQSSLPAILPDPRQ